MQQVFFSVVIVSLNAEKTIRETVQSVLDQTCTDYEIIIKDGLSKDYTLTCVPKDTKIKVYEEKDAGIYDGMNQGISYTKGRYVLFLNCGDKLHSDTVLEKIKDYALKFNTPDIIYGNYVREGEGLFVQPTEMSAFKLVRKPLCHQSMFFSRESLNQLYDLQYRFCADYDLTIKLFLAGKRFSHIDEIICDYEGGGVSESNKKILFNEVKQIRRQFPAVIRNKYRLFEIVTLSRFRYYLAMGNVPSCVKKIYLFMRGIK